MDTTSSYTHTGLYGWECKRIWYLAWVGLAMPPHVQTDLTSFSSRSPG